MKTRASPPVALRFVVPRSWSIGVSQPGSQGARDPANTGTMTGHAAAPGQKSPPWSAERRQRARSQGCAPRLKSADRLGLAPSRRSTPLIVGTEKENEGPGARLYREAKRW